MKKSVQVVVAVIAYQNLYLLGFRQAHQHQGNRYEFIGGKIEENETPQHALIREVAEEINLDIQKNIMIKMGRIYHDYGDKQVTLHIFKINLDIHQYQQLQHHTGNEGQKICWVEKQDILANRYPLPDANARILDWLRLPEIIYITQSLDFFSQNQQHWLNYYQNKLPPSATVYLRPQCDLPINQLLVEKILELRSDIQIITHMDIELNQQQKQQLLAKHLNHQQLMSVSVTSLDKNQLYFASCHDENSLSKINQINNQKTIIACFISPILKTPTHPEKKGIGWKNFKKLTEKSNIPTFSLGGITPKHIKYTQKNMGYGIAGIRLLNNIN